MSRLTDLMRQLHAADPQLGADLESEIRALTSRRNFGLVFERHQPEAVELPGITPKRGSKVRILEPRGSAAKGDNRLWLVDRIAPDKGVKSAHLVELYTDEPEQRKVTVDDLVVVAEFKESICPGLVETGRVERGGDKPFHTVINAENFHALEMLTYTHRGQVDAIYIDPPYNTGAKDWKYNNDYVEGDDAYRHSKWLAMMERRLLVAKELLNPNESVLIVTIDEKEYLRLGLLLEQTFPEARTQMISTLINPAGAGRVADFSRTDEYIFVVQLGNSRLLPESRELKNVPVVWDTLRRSSLAGRRGRKGKGACGPNQFYPIYVSEETGRIESIGEPIPEGMDRFCAPSIVGATAVFPVRPDGTEINWGVTPDVSRKLLSRGYLRAGRKKDEPQQYVISYLTSGIIRDIENGKVVVTGHNDDGSVIAHYPTGKDKMPTTQWVKASHDAQRYGTEILKCLIPGRNFPYPKSLYAVEDVLRMFLGDKPDSKILDFFSGSGSTAHAVMRLNKQDGGRRQCISVTNNEVSADEQKKLRRQGLRPGDPEWESLGICDYITKPRVTAAITGKTPDGNPIKGDYKFTDEFPMADGFEENAAFFTLTYESPLSVRHGRAFERVAPMLWLRAGSQGRIITSLGGRGWDVSDVYSILENFNHAAEFFEALADTSGVRTVFFVTDDDAVFQMACRRLPEDVEPVRLYSSYLQNFEINRGRA
ncbi:site-specific DNA-methyltransferase [Dermabacteraceae bacterium P13115]